MNDKKIKNNYWNIIMIIIVMIFLVLIGYYNLIDFNYRMNSDIASDVLLGKEIALKKQILPDGWIGSTETRLLHTPQLTALVYILTNNLSFSAGVSFMIFALIVIISMLCFVSSLEDKRVNKLVFLLLCLAIPIYYMTAGLLYISGCHYAVITSIMFFTLRHLVLSEKNNKINFIFVILDSVFAFIMGLQGMRGILVIYGPLIGVGIAYVFRKLIFKEKISKDNIYIFIYILMLNIVSFIGTRFPFSVGVGTSRNIRRGFNKLFSVVIPNINKLLGFQTENLIFKICLISILIIALINIIYIIKKYFDVNKKMSIYDWVYLFFWISPVMTAVFVSFTTTEDSFRYYYVLIFALAYTPIYFFNNVYSKKVSCIYFIVCVMSVCTLYTVYLGGIVNSKNTVTDVDKVLEYLDKYGVSNGCATFMNANKITVMSNDRVKVVSIDRMNKMNYCKWLTSTDWYPPHVDADMKTAYIANGEDIGLLEDFIIGKEEHVINSENIGEFKVYLMDYNYAYLGDI